MKDIKELSITEKYPFTIHKSGNCVVTFHKAFFELDNIKKREILLTVRDFVNIQLQDKITDRDLNEIDKAEEEKK